MYVNRQNFNECLRLLVKEKFLGFDTETTCLAWWGNPAFKKIGISPRVFAMQFATAKEEFYFDFNGVLGAEHFAAVNSELCANPEILWFIANAKFDLHHCANHGLSFTGIVHDTKSIARVINNTEEELGLDALAQKYLGAEKLDVITTLEEQKLYTEVKKIGCNDKVEKCLHFDRLPLDQLVKYGERDTRLCYDIGMFQFAKVAEIDREIVAHHQGGAYGPGSLDAILQTEWAVTKTCFNMERRGIKVDRAFCESAYAHDVSEYKRIEQDLNSFSQKHLQTDMDWLSPKQLKKLFDAMGEPYGYTEKGNACFDKDALEESTSGVAKQILNYRKHYKRAHTYFENYLWLVDSADVLHVDFQQNGTQQVRLSCWNPNLQNVPKRADKKEADYKIRKAFVPRPGFVLVSKDWDQMEYRKTLDYAEEMPVIEMIKAGLDPHQDLGNKMNLERDPAKTMQFRILYGAGGKAIGKAINKSESEGLAAKAEYFSHLPAVENLINTVKKVAGKRGYLLTWRGRPLRYTWKTAYKALNGLIQGGCGETLKLAMVETEKLYRGTQSGMVLTVHDELVDEVAPADFALIQKGVDIMENIFPHRHIKLTVGPAFSSKSWGELQDGIPVRGDCAEVGSAL